MDSILEMQDKHYTHIKGKKRLDIMNKFQALCKPTSSFGSRIQTNYLTNWVIQHCLNQKIYDAEDKYSIEISLTNCR